MSKDKIMPEGQVKAVRRASTDQDNSRKSLKTVQHVATDKENLTGRPTKIAGKDAIIKEVKIEIKDKVDSKHKKTEKCVQTTIIHKITVEDLTSDAGPSENYWQVLAEKRRLALEDVLRENKELHDKIAKLEEENRICKDMLDETKNMVEVLTVLVSELSGTKQQFSGAEERMDIGNRVSSSDCLEPQSMVTEDLMAIESEASTFDSLESLSTGAEDQMEIRHEEMIGEQEESGIDLREASTFSVTEDGNETTSNSINDTADEC